MITSRRLSDPSIPGVLPIDYNARYNVLQSHICESRNDPSGLESARPVRLRGQKRMFDQLAALYRQMRKSPRTTRTRKWLKRLVPPVGVPERGFVGSDLLGKETRGERPPHH